MLFCNKAKILSYNIVSLNAILKRGELWPLIESEDPDIFFFQEIKVMNLNKPLVDEFHRMIRQTYPYWGYSFGEFGTCFYSKIKPITWETLSPFGQGRMVKVFFSDVLVINVYAMNAGLNLKNIEKKLKWTKFLSDHIGPKTLLCGDLNVVVSDLDIWIPPKLKKEYQKRPGYSPIEQRDFEGLVRTHKLIDLFRTQSREREYTYFDYRCNENNLFFLGKQNRGWRLDYFFYNGPIPIQCFKVNHIKYKGSDHLPVSLVYKQNDVFDQQLTTVRIKITPWGRIYRQAEKSSEKPMYKMFEYADFFRHHVLLSIQNSFVSYQFTSFLTIDEFKSFYRSLEHKNLYEIIRGKCKIYFDLDNCADPKPFVSKVMNHFDLKLNQVFLKKSKKGYHIICDKWVDNNVVLKDIFPDCDNKVYTKNRFMRLLYSSKWGIDDPFLPIDIDGQVLDNVRLEDYMIQLL